MLRFFRTKRFLVLAGVALLIAVYAVAGFVVAPRLIRSAVLEDIPRTLGVTATVGAIRINPFLLQASVEDFSLASRSGQKLLGFRRLFVAVDAASIWRRAYSFRDIDIDAPYVEAAVAADGSLNLLQLRPPPSPTPTPVPRAHDSAGSLPRLRIGSFKVSQGLLSYEDRSRPDVFSARLEPINFELRDFTTGVEGGTFALTGSTKLGERIEWHGHVSVQPIASDGEFRVDGLLAHTLWEYLEDRLNFAVNSGRVDLAATYRFSAGGGADHAEPNLQVELPTLSLKDLRVRPKAGQSDWITLPSLEVTGTAVDVAKRQARVERVALDGLTVAAWREADGSFNLSTLAGAAAPNATPAAAPPVAPTVTAGTSSSPAVANPPWRFELRQFDLQNASLAFEDRTTHPAAKFLLAPFSVHVTGASQDLGKPVAVRLDTQVNQTGAVGVVGNITPQPAAADLTITLARLDLTAIQPYLARYSGMALQGGMLRAATKLHYGAQKNSPTVQFSGNLGIDQLHTVDKVLNEDFVDWERLDILGLNYTQAPDRLDIDQVVARKPYARVIIASDESININRVLATPGSAAAAPTADGPGPHRAPAGAAPAPAPAPAPSMPMAIKKILIQAGQANFSDLSVTPHFSTGIHALTGSIVGVSSKPTSRAKLDLHGAVDTYSPVDITGELNVLGPTLHTDIGVSFRNIALPLFNPYSGKFAGYNISKGKLNTELHYKVDGRALDAQHHVIIEQLEFGDKTASKEAVSLPVKLAVSLLKDRNGTIDLSLPVSGSLDDPTFRVAPLVWKVLVNLLEKAVTAPFALLGSLFGGGPDLQFIDFAPGEGSLDTAAAEKVKTVAKALIERPQLKIDVPIAVVPDIDRPALINAQFDAELQAAAGASHPYAQLTPAAQLELLHRLYTKDLGAEPKFPDAVTAIKAKPDLAAAKLEFLANAIRARIQVGDSDLQALGQQRAQALQQGLLADTQVAADRVFLVGNDKALAKDGAVRVELTLE